ncbi:MAG TPA: elongation factor P maturation arginine rhamnosyltransferase EarP [Burkholderiaceae bacterium]
MLWDLFCRVIDNHGDLGVCWRLAADLAARGERVRLWVDDAAALAWMAPHGAPGVALGAWPPGGVDAMPGEVVIEAFGCALPPAFVARMAAVERAPVWINLEYLSAEAYVERNHRLLSPQPNGLRKWFFYPGFTLRTGGLIREAGLMRRHGDFVAADWLARHALAPRAGEQVVSLFCYEQPALPALLDRLAQQPTLLLATPGHAARQVRALLGPELRRGPLRAAMLPALTQAGYDELLWACDLNFVRGEDSFVRAQWAGRPFVWQIYPQHDDAHLEKLAAFLDRLLAGADAGLTDDVRAVFTAWNQATPPAALALPTRADWASQAVACRAALLAQDDLCTQLRRFVAETR